MKTIILDTDFLLKGLEWKIDILQGIQDCVDDKVTLCVFDKTFDELKKKPGEKLAKAFLEKNGITVLPSDNNKHVDGLILTMKPEKHVFVATQDKELKEKLKKRNVQILTIRQKSRVIQL